MPKNGDRIALDTNMAIAVLNGSGGVGAWVQSFQHVVLPVPVVGELRFGAVKSSRRESNLQRIHELITQCEVLDIRLSTTEAYSRVRLALRKRGRPIPENDIWIAAICVEHDLPLATFDPHFKEVGEIRVHTPAV